MVDHISARTVIATVLDEGTFASWDEPMRQPERGPAYEELLRRAQEHSGLDESVITGEGRLIGRRVAVVVGDFDFLGGSFGAAASERLVRAIERATAQGLPMLLSPCSGGTRMQEGAPAFLQMVKIGQAVNAHRGAGLPFLVYLRNPTTGGVLASWGSLGHLTVAEPGALVGFLGPRVREILHGSPFPKGVQTAENLTRNGVIDGVVPLAGLRDLTARALDILLGEQSPARRCGEPAVVTEKPAWECVESTRHHDRPGVRELIEHAAVDFVPLRGTGSGESDLTLVFGLVRFEGVSCLLVAQDRHVQKRRALGPAALRTARRGFQLAKDLSLPVVTVVDTPGAELSSQAEEGGLAGEIARCLSELTALSVPVVSVILGEGTGGGALALLPADRTVCAEHGWVAPLPPEGASAIVYRSADHAAQLADEHRIRATDLVRLGAVDDIVPEFPDATDEPEAFCRRIAAAITAHLHDLLPMDRAERLAARHARYRRMV